MKRVLVTGGAGFIGSHTVDLLIKQGYNVRILDNLEYPTHRSGKPQYLNKSAEFMQGDVRSKSDIDRAIRGMDAVIHLAATGGFTSDIAKYIEVNSVGTANLLEVIRERGRKVSKIVVASSVGIYGEGKYECPAHSVKYPPMRSLRQLEAGDWEHRCDECVEALRPVATDESKIPTPEKAYSISKYDGERLVLGFGKDCDIPTVAMRYFLTYGPRQSLTNPYTGVISIFSTRILNNLPPLLYEDGTQLRDFIYVEDVARANLLVLESDKANGQAFNVGTGTPTAIRDIASLLIGRYGVETTPQFCDSFRRGESRHIYSDISRLRSIGFEPQVTLAQGVEKYIEWIGSQGDIKEYFGGALEQMKGSRVVQAIAKGAAAGERAKEAGERSITVVIPSYNEAGNIETIVRYIVAEMEQFCDDFEIIIVNDGSHDGTGYIADDLAKEDDRIRVVHHPFNIGYGGAQKSGFRNARKEWVVVVPADHQFDARDLKRFLDASGNLDVVASRRIDRKDPMIRKIVSGIYNWSMGVLYNTTIGDINWVKMFRRRVFEQMNIESRGFAVDAEMVIKAKALGFRIGEIEVLHYPRTWGVPTSVKFKTVYRTAKELLKIRSMLKRMAKEREKEQEAKGLLRREART